MPDNDTKPIFSPEAIMNDESAHSRATGTKTLFL